MKKQTMGMMISSLRKENGMTQLELAEKMGVTDKAVSKWERDLSCPDVNSLPKLAEIFQISVDELMQVKIAESSGTSIRENIELISQIVFKALALAMGVCTVVLSILKQIDMYSGFSMLGIGLACVAITLFSNKDNV